MSGTNEPNVARRAPGPAVAATLHGLLVAGAAACTLLAGAAVRAGEADVVAATATCSAERVCRFEVTVKHADTGWKHYADRYEVLGPDGTVIGTRVLRHPHVHEQPFTRALGGVEIPGGVDRVTVRAHDSVDGYGGAEKAVALTIPEPGAPGDSGEAGP